MCIKKCACMLRFFATVPVTTLVIQGAIDSFKCLKVLNIILVKHQVLLT